MHVSLTWMPKASTPRFCIRVLGLFLGAVQDPEFAAATCRAYNRWLADYCKPYPDRLFGAAMLPMQSVEGAVQEMRFAAKELGFRAGLHPAQSLQRAGAA